MKTSGGLNSVNVNAKWSALLQPGYPAPGLVMQGTISPPFTSQEELDRGERYGGQDRGAGWRGD